MLIEQIVFSGGLRLKQHMKSPISDHTRSCFESLGKTNETSVY